MAATREEKINEAVARMEQLKMSKNCINAFKNGKVWLSERGMLYEVSKENEQDVLDKIKQIENEYELTVYHLIHSLTEFGELYSMLYVSNHKSEWKDDRIDLGDGCPMSYVWNKTDEWCSEFGSIGVKSLFGGLVRVA